MTAIAVLMVMLLLAYLGSFLVSGRSVRGFGLPSGSEYLVLGAIVGPPVLGMIRRTALLEFEPIIDVLVGWLALIIGLDFGFSGSKRIKIGSILGGIALAVGTFSIVFAAVYGLLVATRIYYGADRFVLAGGVAAACTETTRNAVRWVVERYGAKGPISSVLGEITDSNHIVPILVTAAIFALQPSSTRAFGASIPFWGWALATLALGGIVGATASLLLGREFRLDESWGVLLGASVMGIGIAARIGLSPLATMFITGSTISLLTSHRSQIRRMVSSTERAAMLPALMLAGGLINREAPRFTLAIVGVAIVTRVFALGSLGLLVRAFSTRARAASPRLGLGLLSSGSVAVCVGLAFSFRFPGPVGDAVLATAVAVTLFGEFVGPVTLRHVLDQAGELIGDDARILANTHGQDAPPSLRDPDDPPPSSQLEPDPGDHDETDDAQRPPSHSAPEASP